MSKINIARSKLYKTKGKVNLPLPQEENYETIDMLNETLANIITKKYEGDKNAQS